MSTSNVIALLLLCAVASYGCATNSLPPPVRPAEVDGPKLPPAPPQAYLPPRKATFLERGKRLLFDSSQKPTSSSGK